VYGGWSWRNADVGKLSLEGIRWRVECGGWMMEGCGSTSGGWKGESGGWRDDGGGRRVAVQCGGC